jgi:hypothetical protein
LKVPSGKLISFVPSGKCFSVWLFENLYTCNPFWKVVYVVFASL